MERSAAEAVLTASGLTKEYRAGFLHTGRRLALADLDLSVQRGEVFGYLGPNGSGKTTTLKVLMGLVLPTRGSATILGQPLRSSAWRARVGYLPEHPYFYDYLTPAEYLDYVGRLFGLPRATRRDRAGSLIERVGLTRSADVPMRRFSQGMLQRLGIAQALINQPELIVLDEPMSGLDPIGRRLVRDIIAGLKAEGRSVFFSTHILPDAEALCDRVALLRAGRLVKVGALTEILQQDFQHVEVLLKASPAALPSLPGEIERRHIGDRLQVTLEERALADAIAAAAASGARVLAVQPVRESLEEFFFKELGGAPKGERWDIQD